METTYPLFGYTPPAIAALKVCGRLAARVNEMPTLDTRPLAHSKPSLKVGTSRKAPMFPTTRVYAIASRGGRFESHETWFV